MNIQRLKVRSSVSKNNILVQLNNKFSISCTGHGFVHDKIGTQAGLQTLHEAHEKIGKVLCT